MALEVYTVPDTIIFRNCSVLHSQTRNLLIVNKSDKSYPAFVSFPFSRYFQLLPDHQTQAINTSTECLTLKVPANGNAKVSGRFCQHTCLCMCSPACMQANCSVPWHCPVQVVVQLRYLADGKPPVSENVQGECSSCCPSPAS